MCFFGYFIFYACWKWQTVWLLYRQSHVPTFTNCFWHCTLHFREFFINSFQQRTNPEECLVHFEEATNNFHPTAISSHNVVQLLVLPINIPNEVAQPGLAYRVHLLDTVHMFRPRSNLRHVYCRLHLVRNLTYLQPCALAILSLQGRCCL